MLTIFESITIVLLIVAGSLSFLMVLRRVWPSEQRHAQNDLIGWHVSVLGTAYAVIMGFMLYAVWTNFENADSNAEAEANSVVDVVRSAQSLPAGARKQVRELARKYVEVILTEEWPAMNRLRFSPESARLVEQLWTTVLTADAHSFSEQTSLDHTVTELSEMTEHRRMRQLQSNSHMPGILWTVLIIGAALTIVSACLFGGVDPKLHLIQVFILSLMLSMVLVAIADINRPFQGAVHVYPLGFERARATLNDQTWEGR
jgi:hypothetical protein